jgi:hypothetical protein
MLKININVCRFAYTQKFHLYLQIKHSNQTHVSVMLVLHGYVMYTCAFLKYMQVHLVWWYMNECVDCGHIFHLHTCKCAEKHFGDAGMYAQFPQYLNARDKPAS